MRPILTSLSPNAEASDVLLALKTFLSVNRWFDTNQLKAVESQLSSYFPGHYAALASSGRSALYYLLKALKIRPSDEIIIQAFTCLAVPSVIKWVGAKPVYCDVDVHTFNLDTNKLPALITGRTKAIIIQHTFGIPADIAEITRIAKQHKLIIIEDLAHSLGGTYHHNMLGTLSDAAILSFGRDKIISSVFGGAVIANSPALINKIKNRQDRLSRPPLWWTIQQLFHPIAMAFITRTYFTLHLGKIILVLLQKLHLLSLAVSPKEKKGLRPEFIRWRFSPALAFLLSGQLNKLPRYLERRRRIAKRYAQAFRPDWLTPGQLSQSAWLRFPVLVANQQAVLLRARRERMLLGDWYATPVTPCSIQNSTVTNYSPSSCPNAEYLSARIINLPTYPKMTAGQVEKVIEFIKKIGTLSDD